MAFTRKPTDLKKSLEMVIEGLQKSELRVGWFPSAKYSDGTPIAGVAMVHEFGSPSHNVPPRPFMRPAQKKYGMRWKKFLAISAKKSIENGTDIRMYLDQLGLAVVGDVKKCISEVTSPELKKKTIAAKRRKLVNAVGKTSLEKPLVMTGLLIGSVTHEVTDK